MKGAVTSTSAARSVLLGTVAGAGIVALATLVYAYVATHPPRMRLRRTPANSGLDYAEVEFESTDGVRLSGWLIPAAGGKPPGGIMVVCHGYPCNRQEMLPHAALLHRAGYACLLFDFRALGHSSGSVSTAGALEVNDLIGALNFIESRTDLADLPIGVLGHSLGGAVGIMAAARDERLRAVVAEASYPSLVDALEARFRPVCGPVSQPLGRLVRSWGRAWTDVDAHLVSPLRDIASISPRAVFLIHGERDALVRPADGAKMFAAAGEPKHLWLLRTGRHARCLADSPDEFEERVCAFLQKYLRK